MDLTGDGEVTPLVRMRESALLLPDGPAAASTMLHTTCGSFLPLSLSGSMAVKACFVCAFL